MRESEEGEENERKEYVNKLMREHKGRQKRRTGECTLREKRREGSR